MKNSHSYKAVVYRHASLSTGFWEGSAIDKQINHTSVEASAYWIKDFLLSDFAITAANGTRILANALRDVGKHSADSKIKAQIYSAVNLSDGLDGHAITIDEYCKKFNLSRGTQEAIVAALKNPTLASQKFHFDGSEFTRQVGVLTVELDNGALLQADTRRFFDVFGREEIDQDAPGKSDQTIYKFSTTGSIVDQKLRKRNERSRSGL